MKLFEFSRDRVAWAVIALYAASMACPIFYLAAPGEAPSTQWGIAALMLGWAAPMVDGIFSWYANPLLWTALLLWWRPAWSAALVVAGLALALSFLGVERMSADEAGNHAFVVGYGVGYCVWLAAFSLALLRQLHSVLIARRTMASEP